MLPPKSWRSQIHQFLRRNPLAWPKQSHSYTGPQLAYIESLPNALVADPQRGRSVRRRSSWPSAAAWRWSPKSDRRRGCPRRAHFFCDCLRPDSSLLCIHFGARGTVHYGRICQDGGTGREGRQARLQGPSPKAHPHMLRHACGFALADKGHDTRALQAYLGHKNIQHTTVYRPLSQDRFKDFWR
jgi:integrase